MKKIIKLSESDVTGLVNRILKEDDIENDLLSMIVENVIKEEGEEEGIEKDNPKDVEKFLELADNYLFKKFGKFAEKINTTKEKAMLIASLAKKWGIEPQQLGKVKSILTKENMSPEEAIINEWNPFKKKGGHNKSVDGNSTYTQDELFDYMKKKYGISDRDIDINMSRNVFQMRLKGMIQYDINGDVRGGDNVRLGKAANELHNMMIKESKSKKPINEVNINNTVRKIKARGRAEDYEIERVLDYVRNRVGGVIKGSTIDGGDFMVSTTNTGFNVRKGGERKMMFGYDQIGDMSKYLNEAGGYDDPNIMGKHAGHVIGTIRETLKSIVLGMSGLDSLMNKNQKGEIMGNVEHLTPLIDEAIEILSKAVSDFTEDDLIVDTKKLIGSLKRYNRKLRVLESMGHGYDEVDFQRALMDTSSELTQGISKYIKTLRTVDQRFTKRFTGQDRGEYGKGNDYFNN